MFIIKVWWIMSSCVYEVVKVIVFCYNVIFVYEFNGVIDQVEVEKQYEDFCCVYQVFSFDEVVLVQWIESVGLILVG